MQGSRDRLETAVCAQRAVVRAKKKKHAHSTHILVHIAFRPPGASQQKLSYFVAHVISRSQRPPFMQAGVNETISRFQLILLHDLAVRRTRRAQLSFSTGVNDNDNPPKRFEAGLPGFEFGEPGLAGFEFGEPGLLALRAGRRPYGLSFLP